MNYSLCAKIINEQIPIKSAVERCGIEVSRHGFICCPFHSEKTASLKLYDNSFYCFGCGANGDVISFYSKFYDLNFVDTLKKLNDDFFLNLPFEKRSTLRQHKYFAQKRKQYEEQRRQAENKRSQAELAYKEEINELVRLDMNLRRYKPTEGDTELHPLFVEALHKIDYQYYLNYLPMAGGVKD